MTIFRWFLPSRLNKFKAKKAVWEEQTKPVRDQIALLLEPFKKELLQDFVDKYPPEIQAILAKPAGERNPFEWQMYHKAEPYLTIEDDAAAKTLKGDARKKYQALLADLKKFEASDPGEPPTGIGMKDLSAQAPPMHLLSKGAYDAPLQELQPGFLSIVNPNPPNIVPPQGLNSTGRRTALANWMASPDNPPDALRVSGQSDLVPSLRPGHRGRPQRFRRHGWTPLASGTARLVIVGVRA